MEKKKQIKEQLEQIYKFFIDKQNELIKGLMKKGYDEIDSYSHTNVNMRFLMYEYMRDLFGFNSLPKVVSDNEFNAMQGEVIYHGFAEFDYGKMFLKDLKTHPHNNGFYFSNIKTDTLNYAKNNEDKILKAKLISNNGVDYYRLFDYSKIIQDFTYCTYTDIICGDRTLNDYADIIDVPKFEEITEFFKKFHKQKILNDFIEFFDIFLRDYNGSKFAMLLGYEYIKNVVPSENKIEGCNHTIIFNRGTLAVPESEYNKFISKSKSKKNNVHNPQFGDY